MRSRASTPGLALPLAPARAIDLFDLTKPRLTLLVLLTTVAGYAVGAEGGAFAWERLLAVVGGTFLVVGGANALNQFLERVTDRLMTRTARRPLPDGRLPAGTAVWFGSLASVLGVGLLAVWVNPETAGLAVLAWGLYVFVYTPMKRRSPWSTIVGAIPGAVPALMGWAGAQGRLPVEGWVLFGVVFCWQVPHFMAIAWRYRHEYAAAGFPVLPVADPSGRRTGRQAVWYSLLLLPVSLLPVVLGWAGAGYGWGALGLGALYLGASLVFARDRGPRPTRWLFVTSLIYLPALWALMMADRYLF